MKRHQLQRNVPWLSALLFVLTSLCAMSCDTWVSLPDTTDGPWTILAKNSDRPAFDCQPLVSNPRTVWPSGAVLDLGRIQIPQADETYGTLGSHPYWCWGYEEGINEYGVAIGNEGVWTKPLAEALAAMQRGDSLQVGLTGMDLVRLGLERGKTAREALAVMTDLLEEYGQFGSGTPTADALSGGYDNSFIIADASEAWILETAGRQWVAKRVASGSASISNDLSIRGDWDISSDSLQPVAVQRGWLREETTENLDFRAVYGDDSPIGLTKTSLSIPRSETTLRLQQDRAGIVSPRWMMTIARDQSSSPGVDQSNTASSCVAVLPTGDDSVPVFWWAPARPSVSCYVPFFVHGDSVPDVVSAAGSYSGGVAAPSAVQADTYADDSYWWVFRKLADLATEGIADQTDVVRSVFDPLEERFAAQLSDVLDQASATRLAGDVNAAATALAEFSVLCVEEALGAARTLIAELETASVAVPEHLQPYLGRFESTFDDSVYSVVVKGGSLAIDVPGQRVFELNAPDEQGKWTFALMNTLAVSFHAASEGKATSMILYQNGLALEFLREGHTPNPEVSATVADAHIGHYRNEDAAATVEITHQNGRLAVVMPGAPILELRDLDGEGGWVARATDSVSLRFHDDHSGQISGMTLNRGGQVMQLARDGVPAQAIAESPVGTDALLTTPIGVLLGLAVLGVCVVLGLVLTRKAAP